MQGSIRLLEPHGMNWRQVCDTDCQQSRVQSLGEARGDSGHYALCFANGTLGVALPPGTRKERSRHVILRCVSRISMSRTMEHSVQARSIRWFYAATDADWDALFTEQLPRVYNFFRYRVGIRAEAEDLTSITFERAWRARHRYRRDLAGFSTWLLCIARNVAADHFRKARVHAPLEEAAGTVAQRTPEDEALLQSDCSRLARLLAGLPDRERDILALKYGAGMTNRAIAKLTGLSESNVGTILHRTVQVLRANW